MSWGRYDDDMLDHEKWRRALRIGGDAVLATWERLRSWCSRRLTDGRIPYDMVEEVAQLKGSKTRAKCIRALIEAQLIEQHIDGSLLIVGYLERNPSKAEVIAQRERRAQSQQNRRRTDNVTGHASTSEPKRDSAPSHPIPAQSHPVVDPPVSPKGDKPKREKPRTRVPEDLKPDASCVSLAGEKRVNLADELPRFLDHHRAKGSLMADWQAALRTWISNAAKWGPSKRVPGAAQNQRTDTLAYLAQQRAEALAREQEAS